MSQEKNVRVKMSVIHSISSSSLCDTDEQKDLKTDIRLLKIIPLLSQSVTRMTF